MISRRALLKTTAAVALLPLAARAVDQEAESRLVYITPIQSSGAESSCQSEVWFANHAGAMYVVTSAEAWRAEAVRRGLTSARIWVGDVGPVGRSGGKYRDLPKVEASASLETDAGVQAEVLAAMGGKYNDEWGTWGPRFKNGLADGSRVMLKYVPTA